MVPSYETYRDYREGKLFPSIGKAMVAAAKVNWFGAIYTFTQTSEGVLLQMAKDQSNKIEKYLEEVVEKSSNFKKINEHSIELFGFCRKCSLK